MKFKTTMSAICLVTTGFASLGHADAPDVNRGWSYYQHPTRVTSQVFGLDLYDVYLLKLGFERPGVSVLEAEKDPGTDPIMHYLYISQGKKPQAVKSLNDFKGLVTLKTADMALRFIRLRTNTSFDTLGDWFSAYEVVSSPKVGHNAVVSGMDGELSEKAYKAGGFSPPVVRSTANGYEITRWVCVFKDASDRGRLQKWTEYVGIDGSYHHTVLLTKPFPALPGTSWMQLIEE